jgi:hypothetical protein
MASIVHNDASQLELSLGVLIDDLKSSNGDPEDVQSLNKEIRLQMNQLRAKIKVTVV